MARFTSESNHAMWEARWEALYEAGRADELGPKGQQYIAEKYGEEVELDDGPYDTYEDHGEYDFDMEY